GRLLITQRRLFSSGGLFLSERLLDEFVFAAKELVVGGSFFAAKELVVGGSFFAAKELVVGGSFFAAERCFLLEVDLFVTDGEHVVGGRLFLAQGSFLFKVDLFLIGAELVACDFLVEIKILVSRGGLLAACRSLITAGEDLFCIHVRLFVY